MAEKNSIDLKDVVELMNRPGPPLDIHEWAFDEENKLLHGLDRQGRSLIILNKEQYIALGGEL